MLKFWSTNFLIRTSRTRTSMKRTWGTTAGSMASLSRSPDHKSTSPSSILIININITNPYHQHQQKHDQAYSALGSADRPWALQGSITSGVPKTGHEVATNILIILSKVVTGMKSDRYIVIVICPGFETSRDCQDCFQTWQEHCQRRHQMASPGVWYHH